YQIGRCSAPCVGLVEAGAYAAAMRRVRLFLEGHSDELLLELGDAMEAAAQRLDFEEAARLRDILASLRGMQARQYVDGRAADLDVLAIAMQGASACPLLLAFRDGRSFGSRVFSPRSNGSEDPAEELGAVVAQYYTAHLPPLEVVLDRPVEDKALLEGAFSLNAGRNFAIKASVR